MLTALSDRPDIDKLERFLGRLLQAPGKEVEFVVLFGSMAKGNWAQGSDYDVLIGLRGADGRRLIDRIADVEVLTDGNIQVFPYDQPAWERMFSNRHLLLLESLDHGVVLFDRGSFATMRREFERWRSSGEVQRLDSGWRLQEQHSAGRR